MHVTQLTAILLLLFAQPQADDHSLMAPPQYEEKEIASLSEPDAVECVIMNKTDASLAGEMLKSLFAKLKIRPRYETTAFTLAGEAKPRIVFIKGKEADVSLVKKVLSAIEDAAAHGGPEAAKPFVAKLDLKELGAVTMKRRLLEAARRTGIPITERDLVIYPEGASGALFFIGDSEVAPLVSEMCKGLDRRGIPLTRERLVSYVRDLGEETVKSFGGILSAILSAVAVILLHAVLCRIPVLGERYRHSFRLFWEKLFASFKGEDLAWEIIKAAAELGVSSSDGAQKARGVAMSGEEKKEMATRTACDYIRWRGIDPERRDVRRLIDAAIDAKMAGSPLR